MIADRLSDEVTRLRSEREPFVLATVVRARRPTSVRAGDHAVVRRDGTIDGFVGGVCAESSVRLHSLRVMETGEPLLLALVPDDGADAGAGEPSDGAVVEHNPCLSGGALEIFLEPHLPPSQLVIVGGSPIALALEHIGAASGYDCVRSGPDGLGPLERTAAVVVCTHGNGEEAVLATALRAGVPYVALVASPRRGGAVSAELEVDQELRARLHTPAGLDIGARGPQEIAISILAEIVSELHAHPVVAAPGAAGTQSARSSAATPPSGPATTATDPVCGMTVAVSPASVQLHTEDGDTVYFCGTGCRDRWAADRPGVSPR